MSGPALVKSSLPTLNPPETGASCSTSFSAASAVGTSKATMMGFRMQRNCNSQLPQRNKPRTAIFDFPQPIL